MLQVLSSFGDLCLLLETLLLSKIFAWITKEKMSAVQSANKNSCPGSGVLDRKRQENFILELRRYMMESRIFRTDAVKIIKLTIRPIGGHHPRSSYLPHVDTGPTVSFIFGTLPEVLFCPVSSTLCDSAWISSVVSNGRLVILNFIFEKGKKSQGAKSGCTMGGGLQPFCILP
jgi:hypothetical protein